MGKNKDADQLRGNREADQRLCFRYTDSTFPPLLIPKFSRFWVSSVTVQAGLCWTWSETQIVGFVMHRLNSYEPHHEKNTTCCISENKGADQRLCFRSTDSTIPLLSKSKMFSLYPSSVIVHLGLCQTCSETTMSVLSCQDSFCCLFPLTAGEL